MQVAQWAGKYRGPWLAVAVGVSLLLGVTSYHFAFSSNVNQAREANAQRLDFYVASLDSLLEKHESLPHLIALERDVRVALLDRKNNAKVMAANRYLEIVRERTHVAAVYILDLEGNTIAASNWRSPQSFVGQNYGFRPYFREAVEGRRGRFYAIGATTGEPGYFLTVPVRPEGRIIGVAAVKVSLDEFEGALIRSGEHLMVVDGDGVIFLSTVKSWKYRTTAPLPSDVRQAIDAARKYGDAPLVPIARNISLSLSQEGELIELSLPVNADAEGRSTVAEYLVQARPIERDRWRLVLVSSLASARSSASGLAAAVGFAIAFLFAIGNIVYQRRRRRQERHEARTALQNAYDELELRIAERTADLVAAKASLQEKISALKKTESILRESQDTAVQVGKLAVLGQMSAGITHELNQPLTALITLSENSIKLLNMTRVEDVHENLRTMASLTDRMGRIVGQLKTFARKGPANLEAVSVRDALSNALLLIEPHRREHAFLVEINQPDSPVFVTADAIRLEQVLVNLLRNAIDAMETATDRKITIRIELQNGKVAIRIRDRGPGIAPESLAHLFEPFYTTKPVGKGLGLGLAISLAIVQSFGGELRADNVADGGAEFTLELNAV